MAMPPQMPPTRKPTAVFAVCLIGAGIVLFLGNLGLLPIHRVWDLWPLIFTFIGLGRLTCSRRTPGKLLVGIAFVIIGIVATLFTTGIFEAHFHDDNWWISLVLIGIGVAGLARVLDGEPWHFAVQPSARRWAKRQRRLARAARRAGVPFPAAGVPWSCEPFTNSYNSDPTTAQKASTPNNQADEPFFSFEAKMRTDSDTDPVLNDHTVMGSIKRSVLSQNFEGGKLTSILGNIEIDLRRSKLSEGRRSVQIEIENILGHIALRVPDAWHVVWNGDNFLGNFEDRTIPPNNGLGAPELILTGSCTMGSIEVES
jgi:predicted membrane protein